MRPQLFAAAALLVAAPALANDVHLDLHVPPAQGYHQRFKGSPPNEHQVPPGEVHFADTIAAGHQVFVHPGARLVLAGDLEPTARAELQPPRGPGEASVLQIVSSKTNGGRGLAMGLVGMAPEPVRLLGRELEDGNLQTQLQPHPVGKGFRIQLPPTRPEKLN